MTIPKTSNLSIFLSLVVHFRHFQKSSSSRNSANTMSLIGRAKEWITNHGHIWSNPHVADWNISALKTFGKSVIFFTTSLSGLGSFRKGVQNYFFFERSLPNVGGWGGWFPNKVQTPKSPRKSPFLTQISPFLFPNLTKTLGWVHGFTHWGNFPK